MRNKIFFLFSLFLFAGCGNQEPNHFKPNSSGHEHADHNKSVNTEQAGMPEINKGRTPSFVFDDAGKLWCVWAFGKHVYVSYSDDEGGSYSEPVKVNDEPQEIATNGENRPKIVISPNGYIYVSYSISLEEKFTGLVKFSRSVDNGKTFSEPVTVNDDKETAGHSFESLGVNKDGIVYLFWLDSRLNRAAKKEGKNYNGSSVFYTYSDDGGQSFKPNKKIADHTCQCCRIALDFEPDGNPVIIFRDIYNENVRDHSMVRFTGKDSFTKPERVTFENWKIDGCPHHGPSLYIDSEGRYHFTWYNMEGNSGKIYYAVTDDKGKIFKNRKVIPNETASHPYITGINNKLYLVWKEYRDGKNLISGLTSDNGGKDWTNKKNNLSVEGNLDHPFLIKKSNKILLAEKGDDKIFIVKM
ncbi:MAG: sialidase family protein [Ignavibacteriaceae bacterium]